MYVFLESDLCTVHMITGVSPRETELSLINERLSRSQVSLIITEKARNEERQGDIWVFFQSAGCYHRYCRLPEYTKKNHRLTVAFLKEV